MPGKTWNGLAVDLGASGGRVIAGSFDGKKISIDITHRFENEPVQVHDTLYWDILRLYHEVKHGIRQAISRAGDASQSVNSLGFNSWGVDFGLLDVGGQLLNNPVHYRDHRTEGMMDVVFSRVPKEAVYDITGIQFLPFNTIFQLAAIKHYNEQMLNHTDTLLMIPDLFNYFLTGEKVSEFTDATTTQLMDARTRKWSDKLITSSGFPRRIFQSIMQPGTVLGHIKPAVQGEVCGGAIKVVAVATHDTGSAVAAVPAQEKDFAYLSCGTWALLGTEVPQPIISAECLQENFTNEGGVEGTFRFLKNLAGLWLLQETRRHWSEEGIQRDWNEITEMTTRGKAFRSFIDPDDERFLPHGNMPERVRKFCRETCQSVPQDDQDIVRCITESMTLKIRYVFERLQKLSKKTFTALHIVGGGSQNKILCQWIADSLGILVLAGPVEATTIGNLGVQLMAAGEISSLHEMRRLIANSVKLEQYTPRDTPQWQDAYSAFLRILSKLD